MLGCWWGRQSGDQGDDHEDVQDDHEEVQDDHEEVQDDHVEVQDDQGGGNNGDQYEDEERYQVAKPPIGQNLILGYWRGSILL